MARPATIAAMSQPCPTKTPGIDRHARVRQREDRQDSVARPRAGVPQQPVGGRFESVVDRVERAQRRRARGRACSTSPSCRGLGGDDGAGLRHQGSQVRQAGASE